MLHNDVILKKGTESNPGYKLVVPKNCIINFVKHEHLQNAIIVFPKMERRVRQTVAGCELCQCIKISRRSIVDMQLILPDRPRELVCIDLIGPLPS